MAELKIFRVDHSTVSTRRFEACMTINGDAAIFKEHFPDYPIVPGACIVGFVSECIVQMKETGLGVLTLQRVAFLGPIIPDLMLSLVIDKRPDVQGSAGESYIFRIHHETINYCRGVITVGGDGR
ncbi:hypothetical protein LZV00_01045 [Pseudomonas kielensis]|uniref:hypothetical protein n=1 Tax=Pseudomonas kielensis TaxID=2762577 RepID=UPI00223F2A69|nr:hypothetical protein [Pseudomonas kielensis]UZM14447.1 hypothetical protein LZV00_01045 [Pseudomonas kielensis]